MLVYHKVDYAFIKMSLVTSRKGFLTCVSAIWEVARPVVAGAKAAAEPRREARIASFMLFRSNANFVCTSSEN